MIFTRNHLIKSCPACDYVVREVSPYIYDCHVVDSLKGQKFIQLKHGEFVQIGEKAQGRFSVWSIFSSAIEDGEDPIKAFDRATQLGHITHGFIAHGSMITNCDDGKRDTVIVLNEGQIVHFEGKFFKVLPDFNNNMKMVRILN